MAHSPLVRRPAVPVVVCSDRTARPCGNARRAAPARKPGPCGSRRRSRRGRSACLDQARAEPRTSPGARLLCPRARAGLHALLGQSVAQLAQEDPGLRLTQGPDQASVLLDGLRAPVATAWPGPNLALAAVALRPPAGARHADPEARRRLMAGCARRHGGHNTFAQINGQGWPHGRTRLAAWAGSLAGQRLSPPFVATWVPSRRLLEIVSRVSGTMPVSRQAARSIMLSAGG